MFTNGIFFSFRLCCFFVYIYAVFVSKAMTPEVWHPGRATIGYRLYIGWGSRKVSCIRPKKEQVISLEQDWALTPQRRR